MINTYTVETIKSENQISLPDLPTDLKQTTHKIAIPWNVNKSDLTQIMDYVDRLRKDYPSQPWIIYEHIKQVIDY